MNGFNVSALAVRERAVTVFFILLTVLLGTQAFFALGRAEDPAFTVRAIVVSALWPGASTAETETLLAAPLERRLRQLPWYSSVDTAVRAGRVDLTLEFDYATPAEKLPELFRQVHRVMAEEGARLPAGVLGPFVDEDFPDGYFSLYALRGPGLPQRQLIAEAERVRARMAAVDGVRAVRLFGERPQRIYVDLDEARLATLGLNGAAVVDALDAWQRLLPVGAVETRGPRVALRADAALADLDDLRAVPVPLGDQVVRVGDIARVHAAYEEPPQYLVRAHGEDALVIGVVMGPGVNGLRLGADLAALERSVQADLPLGLSVERLTSQADAITGAVTVFQKKFFIAVGVVVAVSMLALGWRAGLVVGIAVPLTMGLTFLCMQWAGIALDRISLGALIVALGLLVDDAIIAIEMMLVKLEEGLSHAAAAAQAWVSTAGPMLSGTAVTVIGFLPIGFARGGVGEYAGNVFWVLAYALGASWLVAVLFTPVLGVALLKVPAHHAGPDAPVPAAAGARLRPWIRAAIRHRRSVLAATAAVLALAVAVLVLAVPKQFFPTSDRPEVLVDLNLPPGSGVAVTEALARRVEDHLRDLPEVRSLGTYIGAGAPRFFLALSPQMPDPAFARVVAVTADAAARDRVMAALRQAVDAGDFAQARVRVHSLLYGPPVQWPVSYRLLGPDRDRVRELAAQLRTQVAAHPAVRDAHLSSGERAPELKLDMDPQRLRLIGLTPRDLAAQLALQLDGTPAAELRVGTRIEPVLVRGAAAQTAGAQSPDGLYVSTQDGRSVPLTQAGEWRVQFADVLRERYDGLPSVEVRAQVEGAEASDVMAALDRDLAPLREALPPGFEIRASGTAEQSDKANASIARLVPYMVGLMLIVIMVQMRSFTGAALVLASAPLGLIGVVPALLLTGNAFGFVALLGVIGLAGILMRNTLIVAQQIDTCRAQGLGLHDAVVEATVGRVRPVVLTAGVAALAFVPLVRDTFWGPLACALIGGVVVGTVITLGVVPALCVALADRAVGPAPGAAGARA